MFTKSPISGFITFVSLLLFQSCIASKYCPPSSCGNISNISYPFRLKGDPKKCGDNRYSLSCENNHTVLKLFSGKYHVQAINYNNFTIRVVDAGFREDNCSSIPHFNLATGNFTDYGGPYVWYKHKWTGSEWYPELSQTITFMSCENAVNFTAVNSALYVDTAPCLNGVNSFFLHSRTHSYVNVRSMNVLDLMDLCSIEFMTMLPAKDYRNMSFREIHNVLAYGFELSWFNIHCKNCTHKKEGCYLIDSNPEVQCSYGPYERNEAFIVLFIRRFSGRLRYVVIWIILYSPFTRVILGCGDVFRYIIISFSFTTLYLAIFVVVRTLCGTPIVIGFLILKWRRRHLSAYNTIEEFLQNHNNLMPIRYSYSDIKKMTKGFKDKLGEGGFGKVYKGKLRSGQFAAIKILDKPKANGEEFISEVATIGRIHHVNVVNLIGFCVEGSKRALVYEFMPNGSLDKYIFCQEGTISLSWEKLYEISLGVAHGIEYLHRGCDMRILHFDIKPHNILLEKDFTPKVSDFGLAKLYPTNESNVALTAARGTMGYMAPELFYKNIGHVSYKADVYSFGMLLLEMAGRRKNLNPLAEKSSQIYFPFWVYDQMSTGKGIKIEEATEEENRIANKMIVVGLWCIQMNPSNRPSMSKVVEMFESDLENLQLPPRPILYPEETMMEDVRESSSCIVDDSTETISLIMSFNHASMSTC